ncbi:MAG: hypothetical protein ACOC57_01390 [Acidobacteriota bacterium]
MKKDELFPQPMIRFKLNLSAKNVYYRNQNWQGKSLDFSWRRQQVEKDQLMEKQFELTAL